ncbi:translation initiation factor IF-2-like [Lutra lutra]|uniref:translation initiation factor IF-2-like n=1 Tax=Lutra lutra TaxID=9657 RepID=UPI001FD5A6ED|nr:translation initiation factor IF-2-like [Lutra lutra]
MPSAIPFAPTGHSAVPDSGDRPNVHPRISGTRNVVHPAIGRQQERGPGDDDEATVPGEETRHRKPHRVGVHPRNSLPCDPWDLSRDEGRARLGWSPFGPGKPPHPVAFGPGHLPPPRDLADAAPAGGPTRGGPALTLRVRALRGLGPRLRLPEHGSPGKAGGGTTMPGAGPRAPGRGEPAGRARGALERGALWWPPRVTAAAAGAAGIRLPAARPPGLESCRCVGAAPPPGSDSEVGRVEDAFWHRRPSGRPSRLSLLRSRPPPSSRGRCARPGASPRPSPMPARAIPSEASRPVGLPGRSQSVRYRQVVLHTRPESLRVDRR